MRAETKQSHRVSRMRPLGIAIPLVLLPLGISACSSNVDERTNDPTDRANSRIADSSEEGHLRWTEMLGSTPSVGGDVTGVDCDRDGLRLMPTGWRGLFTFAPHRLEQRVDRVWATPSADVPPGSEMDIEVRGRSIGGSWSEWRIATSKEPARLPSGKDEIQVRVALTAGNEGRSPVLSALSLHAAPASETALAEPVALAPLTFRVFATREGLVGGTTANGHVIKPRDHFVALPSRRGLSSKGGHEYTVTVRYNGRTATAPVWDVGPWNTKDDYWNVASVREMWRDLPLGKPESQAAYQDGYNGGKDQFGRRVANPAGIDLADGTFWDDLGMTDNAWVDVTYNWTSGGGSSWETIVDDATAGQFHASANWGTSSWSSSRYGTSYRFATPEAVSDPAWFSLNVPAAGNYEALVYYPADAGYNSQTPFMVNATDGIRTIKIDQRSNGGRWVSLGVFPLAAGEQNAVGVSRWTSTTGYVVADAVKLIRR